MNQTTTLPTIGDIEARYEDAKNRLEALTVETDEDYVQACELAKAVAASKKAVEETEEVAEKKRLYKLYKKYGAIESAVTNKLEQINRIVRSQIAAYAIRVSQEAEDEQMEKAIAAAVATGDEGYLDMIMPATVKVPEVPGVGFAEVTDFEVEDVSSLPEELIQPDNKAIRNMIRALGEEADIPGVRVFKRKQVRITATE